MQIWIYPSFQLCIVVQWALMLYCFVQHLFVIKLLRNLILIYSSEPVIKLVLYIDSFKVTDPIKILSEDLLYQLWLHVRITSGALESTLDWFCRCSGRSQVILIGIKVESCELSLFCFIITWYTLLPNIYQVKNNQDI